MAGHSFAARLLSGLRDPWALLLAVFGGAMVWAFGSSLFVSGVTAAAMLATAAGINALTRSADESAGQLRAGTRQYGLINLLDGHLRSLRELQTAALPDVVRTKVDAALAAADTSRPAVVRLAAAVDALDEAISAARKVAGQGAHATESISKTVARLRARRAKLFGGLTAAVDEVATVYAGLLELSATARTIGVALDDTEVGGVNDAVAVMQMTFAELEADAANLPTEGQV